MARQTRFIWFLAVLVAAIITLLNFIWLFRGLEETNKSVEDLQTTVVVGAAREIDLFIESRRNILQTLSNVIVSVDETKRRDLLLRFLSEERDFRSIAFADRGGIEKYAFKRDINRIFEENPKNILISPHYWKTIAGETYLGLVFISEELRPTVSMAVPVVDPVTREVLGSVRSDLDLRSIWKLVQEITFGSEGKTYVVDHLGRLIADSDPTLVLKGVSYIDRLLIEDTLKENASISGLDIRYRYENEEGVEMVSSSAFVPETGWIVAAEEPLDVAFAAASNLKLLAMLLFGVGVILVVVVFYGLKKLDRLIVRLDLEKQQTAAIIYNLTDGLIEYSEDFRIVLINPLAEKIFGVSAGEVVGRKFGPHDVSIKKFSSLVRALFPVLASDAKTLKADSVYLKSIEFKIDYPLERDLQIFTIPTLNAEGKVLSYLKIVRDVSREKTISRLKSEFISLAAHQLRTPLSAIKWIFRMLLDGDIGKLSEEQESIIQKGYGSNERMIRLVNDLLNVTRIEEGRFGYEFDQVDLQGIIEEEVAKFSIISDNKGLVLRFNKPENALPKIKIDIERIRMVLSNLIDNAVQYTPSGGKIEINLEREGDFAKVLVSDSGIGISEEDQKRLFTKFFRGADVVKMQTEGTGLGLFIAKNIVKRHGGDIRVESKKGEGTDFYFTLPLKESMVPPKETAFKEFIE